MIFPGGLRAEKYSAPTRAESQRRPQLETHRNRTPPFYFFFHIKTPLIEVFSTKPYLTLRFLLKYVKLYIVKCDLYDFLAL